MNTPFLLESNLKWNPLLQTFPIHYSSFKPTNHFIKHSFKFTQTPKFHIKCSSFYDIPTRAVLKSSNKQNPVQILTETIIKTLKSLQKPAITAVLLGILLLSDPNNVIAASGGRMGGKSFSRPSMSSSRSYSTPRIDSGRTFSSAPYFGPPPFGGGGFYVGPAVGIGSTFFFIMAGFAAFVLVSGFLSDRSDDGLLTATEKTSVLKLQVGLLGMARSLQQDLNRIAERADTSTPEGLSYVLTETMLALLRHPDFCISAYSSVDVKRSMDEGEKRFNQLSIEERGKFDEETLVNVNNIKKQSATSRRANGFRNEYIVITILVAAEGVHKLPSINNSGDLKQALQVLASIPSSRTLAVEVLWTPQNEDDTLSERELLEDYSLLRPL
ncbi:FLUCTUATING-LIGHT-ACCLIMATION protein 1, chloroplastic-like [Apium graveolens]|uniref:FLUCTUATING-LIGHT-ACCLIMATION protein 1, chloroplastic-like n=1 Tax=Apium graveolens TaxID=4045 RepID=UPI003D7939B9